MISELILFVVKALVLAGCVIVVISIINVTITANIRCYFREKRQFFQAVDVVEPFDEGSVN